MQKAQGLIREMLDKVGWTEGELGQRPKGDRNKAKMAARLRAKTTMIGRWIAEELVMGHGRIAANTVRAADVESSEMTLAMPILL